MLIGVTKQQSRGIPGDFWKMLRTISFLKGYRNNKEECCCAGTHAQHQAGVVGNVKQQGHISYHRLQKKTLWSLQGATWENAVGNGPGGKREPGKLVKN